MKNYLSIILVLAVILFAVSTSYGLAPEPMGSLKAYAVSSDTPHYIQKWVTNSSSHGQGIRVVTSFEPGETAYTAVIVTGYTVGENGAISLEAGFEIIKPDGGVFFEEK